MNNMTRRISFRYDLLNNNELKIGELDNTTGSVSMDAEAIIKRTGRFNIKENVAKEIDYLNDRIKPIMIIDGVEYPLGIYLMPSPERTKKIKSVFRKINAYDVTQVLMEDKITNRYYTKKGTEYIDVINRLINSAGIARVDIIPTEAVVTRDREFEIGTSKIDIVNDLLKEINYTSLYVDSVGVVTAKPYEHPATQSINHQYQTGLNANIVLDKTEDDFDVFNVPNVFVCYVSNPDNPPLVSRFINDNPNSPVSTVRRHRNIVQVSTVKDIADQETLDAYVKRLAYDAANTHHVIKFETMNNPNHGYSDAILIKDDDLKINNKYIESGWEMNLSVGGTMKHTVNKVVIL